LAEYHRDYFGLSSDEAAVFNKNQRIVLVGQKITPEIRQTSAFLRSKGIRATCVEFSFFKAGDGRRLLSVDIVVGREPFGPATITSKEGPRISPAQFLESLDAHGRPVFQALLQLAHDKGLATQWGTKGFSLNVNVDGTHVPFCYGYPPKSVWKQSVYTALIGAGGMLFKISSPEEARQLLYSDAQATGLFQPAGKELKCLIDQPFSEDKIQTLLGWCEKAAAVINEHGLKE
jgi:hypothetical protein